MSELSKTKIDTASPVDLANFIANQISIEQSLSNARMTWNLTFQGFAVAGYALVATANGSEPAKIFIQVLICISAFVVALATWLGLEGSNDQRKRLREFWSEKLDILQQFPAPFSQRKASSWGRFGPRLICGTIMVMWAGLFVAGFALTEDTDRLHRFELTSEAKKITFSID